MPPCDSAAVFLRSVPREIALFFAVPAVFACFNPPLSDFAPRPLTDEKALRFAPCAAEAADCALNVLLNSFDLRLMYE